MPSVRSFVRLHFRGDVFLDTDWLGPEQSQSLKRQLSEMKSKITKVAEELDSLKQEMTEPQKQRINGLLNLIDKVVPILPRSQERVPSPPPSLPDIRIKEETHL